MKRWRRAEPAQVADVELGARTIMMDAPLQNGSIFEEGSGCGWGC